MVVAGENINDDGRGSGWRQFTTFAGFQLRYGRRKRHLIPVPSLEQISKDFNAFLHRTTKKNSPSKKILPLRKLLRRNTKMLV